MKKKLFLIIAVLLVAVALFGGCGVTSDSDKVIDTGNAKWGIDKSPITGRYYEIRYDEGFRHNAMSEVTEQEYNKYLEMIQEK